MVSRIAQNNSFQKKGNKMKKNILILFFSAFLANVLFGAIVITDSDVSKSDFDTAFNSEKVWYFQAQAGADSGSNSNEFEIGKDDGASYLGETSWVNDSSHSFSVAISESNFLSATVNGVSTPDGNQPGIDNPFNEIWIGLKLASSDNADTLNISHEYGTSLLPVMTLNNSTGSVSWFAFKFYDDQKEFNIADFTINGEIIIDFFGGPGSTGAGEEWEYTIFGTHNPAIPEPSTYALISGIIALLFIYRKRTRY